MYDTLQTLFLHDNNKMSTPSGRQQRVIGHKTVSMGMKRAFLCLGTGTCVQYTQGCDYTMTTHTVQYRVSNWGLGQYLAFKLGVSNLTGAALSLPPEFIIVNKYLNWRRVLTAVKMHNHTGFVFKLRLWARWRKKHLNNVGLEQTVSNNYQTHKEQANRQLLHVESLYSRAAGGSLRQAPVMREQQWAPEEKRSGWKERWKEESAMEEKIQTMGNKTRREHQNTTALLRDGPKVAEGKQAWTEASTRSYGAAASIIFILSLNDCCQAPTVHVCANQRQTFTGEMLQPEQVAAQNRHRL